MADPSNPNVEISRESVPIGPVLDLIRPWRSDIAAIALAHVEAVGSVAELGGEAFGACISEGAMPSPTREELLRSHPPLFAPQRPLGNAMPEASPLAEAVLLLIDGQDDRSHAVSQSREGTVLFDHAHAIMHRREADFGNAMYWVRRIGGSPVFDDLPSLASASLDWLAGCGLSEQTLSLFAPLREQWDAPLFLDLVRQTQTTDSDDAEAVCRVLQFDEMIALMRFADVDA